MRRFSITVVAFLGALGALGEADGEHPDGGARGVLAQGRHQQRAVAFPGYAPLRLYPLVGSVGSGNDVDVK